MGVFSILFGAGWVGKQVVSQMYTDGKNAGEYSRQQQYIMLHTDKELELEYVNKIYDETKHDELWRELETFKRDNPVWCGKNEKNRSHSFIHYTCDIGWQDIGKGRLDLLPYDFTSTTISTYKRTPPRYTIENTPWTTFHYASYFSMMDDNHEMLCTNVLRMLMQTHGLMTFQMAEIDAHHKFH